MPVLLLKTYLGLLGTVDYGPTGLAPLELKRTAIVLAVNEQRATELSYLRKPAGVRRQGPLSMFIRI